MFTNFFIGALYLQHIRGFTAFQTGLAFLPTTLTVGVMSSGISARLMARVGARNLLIVGLAIIVTALAILSDSGPATAYAPQLIAAYTLLGAGAGVSFLPLLTISMSEVPAADAGLASGFSNVTVQVGAALGLAAVGTITSGYSHNLLAQGESLSTAVTAGYQLAYLLAAGLVVAALVVVVATLRAGDAARVQAAERDREPSAEVEAA